MEYMKIEDLEPGDIVKFTTLKSWMNPVFIEFAEKFDAEIFELSRFGSDLYLVVNFIDKLGKTIHEGQWQIKSFKGLVEVVKLKEEIL